MKRPQGNPAAGLPAGSPGTVSTPHSPPVGPGHPGMHSHFHQGLFAVAGGATDHSLLDHFTFFGSTFLMMPNAINVRQTGELFATFEDNPVVVTTVGCLCVTYVLVVIWEGEKMFRIRPRNGREGKGCPTAEGPEDGAQVGSREVSCKSRPRPPGSSQAPQPLYL